MTEDELYEIFKLRLQEYNEVFKNIPLGLDWKGFNKHIESSHNNLMAASRNYRMVQVPNFNDKVPEFGEVMAIKIFIKYCKNGFFNDYDGSGEYIKNGKLSGITILPSDIEHNMVREDFKKIIWFNK